MGRAPLRVVTGESADSIEMQDAIMGVARECVAAQPTAVMVVWEAGGKVVVKSIPNSDCLMRGMSAVIFDKLHPEMFVAAED